MMQEEEGFEGSLGKRDGGWGEEWKEWMREARGKEKREQERNNVSLALEQPFTDLALNVVLLYWCSQMQLPPKLQARANRLSLERIANESNTLTTKAFCPLLDTA